MSWLSRLFGGLLGRKPKPAVAPFDLGSTPAPSAAAALEPAPSPGGSDSAPAPVADPEGLAVVEVEADEDAFEEEERAEVSPLSAEADLDRRPDLDVIVAERQSRMGDSREEAFRKALSGEQRIRLTDPAGPGTLAEALAQLEQEGRVTSRVGEDAEGAPVLIYTPVAPPPS